LARSFNSASSARLQLPSRSRCEVSSRATRSISVSRRSHQPSIREVSGKSPTPRRLRSS
jgi:hypothetical protein